MYHANLSRFTEAHERYYSTALREIQNGRKETHWMWFIFPQIKGIGRSQTAQYYAIQSMDEARAFLQDPYLGRHLVEISNVLMALETDDPKEVFYRPDDRKLKYSMTLFALISEDGSIFHQVLEKYYHGKMDGRTLRILNIGNHKTKWMVLLTKVDNLNRRVKEPGWMYEDKQEVYRLKDDILKHIMKNHPQELTVEYTLVPYYSYSRESKDRAGDLMRRDPDKKPFEYYLGQIRPGAYDVEIPEKALIEVLIDCGGLQFCFHQPVSWYTSNGGEPSVLPKKTWINPTDFHHLYLERTRNEIAELKHGLGIG